MSRDIYGPFHSPPARPGRFGERREEPLPTGGIPRHSLRRPSKPVPALALFPAQAGGTARPEPVPPPRKRPYPRPAIPDIVPDIYRLYDSGTLPDRRPQRQVPSTCHNPTNRRQRSLRKKLAENKRKPVVPCHRIRKPVSRRKGKSGSRTGRADRRPSDKSDRHSKPHTRGKGTEP